MTFEAHPYDAVFTLPLPGPSFLPKQEVRLRVSPLSCGAVRVSRTMRESFLNRKSDVVIGGEAAACQVSEGENQYLVDCGGIQARIGKERGDISFLSMDGSVLLKENERRPCVMEEKPVIKNRFREEGEITVTESVDGIRASGLEYEAYEDRKAYACRLSFDFDENEGLYGLGSHEEGYGNLRGKERQLYQHNMKAVVPMLLSTKGWAVLFDMGCLMAFHDDAQGSYLWADCADEMDYYFLWGDSEQIYSQYRELTGPAPLLPRYAFGYVQSKERYKDANELIDVVKEYRRRQVPLDVIVEDWQSWPEGQWGFKVFDESRFPDPKGLTDTLHEMGAKMMISVWPSMQGDKNENQKEMQKNGCMLGNRVIYNAFDEKAREIYWRQARDGLFRYGVDAWWCDCSEPFEGDWHGKIKPEPFERVEQNTREAKKYMDPGKISLYSLYHSMGIYQGQRKETEKKRVLNLTRSSWAGQHRYATVTWSGDVSSTWEVLRRQVPEGLNFMATGEAWWSTDAGGFFPTDFGGAWFGAGDFQDGANDPGFRELFVRWMQFAAFLPMMRAHGTGTPREIWRFGEKGDSWYDALEKIIRLRSRMVPLWYSLAARYAFSGLPPVRPIALAFPQDLRLRQIDDEMLLGSGILVKPVTHPMEYLPKGKKMDPVDDRECVYLPAGSNWYAFESGERFEGGQTVTVHAPIDTVPLFIREGTVLMLGPVKQYTDEKTEEPLTITVYPGQDGCFTWYEDEGDGYGYEKGEWAKVLIAWKENEGALTLSARQGSFPGMEKERKLLIQLPGGKPISLVYTGDEVHTVLPKDSSIFK